MTALSKTPARGVLAGLLLFGLTVGPSADQRLPYPKARKGDQVDVYHGTAVPDPYRWLEDEASPERTAWIEAQNRITFAYLEAIPFRARVRARLQTLYDYPKYSAPFRKREYFYFSKNEGLQNQSVLYRQQGLEGTPEVVIDPNTFSADGTASLGPFSLAGDGRHAVYGIARGGSDWRELFVMELATRRTLADTLEWVKVSGVGWRGDGFYYSRYPAPEKGRELTARNEYQAVYFHRIGTPQSADELVYEDRANPQRFHNVSTTEDERFAVLSISERGKGKKGNALFVRDFAKGDTAFRPIVATIGDDTFGVIDNVGDKLLVRTNRAAPNGRIVLVDPARPDEAAWQTIVPERPEAMQGAGTAGGKIFVSYLKDVVARVVVHGLDGRFENEVELPGVGSAGGFSGERDDTFVFYTFNSLNVPPTIYRYDLATGRSQVFRAPAIPAYDATRYETRQVFYTSKDGTRVPLFLVHRAGLTLDGRNPTLLYGYGGFNISMTPSFSPLRLALLEQGVVYAQACLRGGGEYGERWHEAGTKLKKQNVFDDFIAAAEWLIASKYTSPERLAIQGGSNGGLLVGAVVNQRPELFRAAVPQVGVMDMLRYHKFTIGWNWAADYGSSDNPDEFKALYAYSPLHNIRAGGRYPATLVTTADHDDRVVPAHSLKYLATLQERAAPGPPLLIRVETRSGHGASSTTKALDTTADVYTFLLHVLGVGL